MEQFPADLLHSDIQLIPLSRVKAGKELINPFLPTDDVLARGKLIFTTFCIGCHGALGKGDGQLIQQRSISVKTT